MSKLYHSTIYMPTEYMIGAMRCQSNIDLNKVKFSVHIKNDHFERHDKKHLATQEQVLNALKTAKETNVVPFEVEVEDGKLIKYCIRLPLNKFVDISIAIMPNKDGFSFIKTAWNNNSKDQHYTLDESKYETRP